MNEAKEIFSMIYGGWKKTDVQDLVVVRCEHCEHCSLYKNGICANVPRILAPSCPFGNTFRTRGYSERAGAYLKWASEIRKRSSYDALKAAPDCFVARVDKQIMTPLYAGIYWKADTQRFAGPNFCSLMTSLPIAEWTPEKLKALYDYVPLAMFGYGPVKGWKEKRDYWFTQMMETAPDIVSLFLQKYPEIKISVSHVGREAKVNSLRDGIKLKDSNNTWEKRGDNLICQNYSGFYFGLFGEKKPSCVISCPVTESMTYKITAEDMIDENTVFVT